MILPRAVPAVPHVARSFAGRGGGRSVWRATWPMLRASNAIAARRRRGRGVHGCCSRPCARRRRTPARRRSASRDRRRAASSASAMRRLPSPLASTRSSACDIDLADAGHVVALQARDVLQGLGEVAGIEQGQGFRLRRLFAAATRASSCRGEAAQPGAVCAGVDRGAAQGFHARDHRHLRAEQGRGVGAEARGVIAAVGRSFQPLPQGSEAAPPVSNGWQSRGGPANGRRREQQGGSEQRAAQGRACGSAERVAWRPPVDADAAYPFGTHALEGRRRRAVALTVALGCAASAPSCRCATATHPAIASTSA